MRHEKHSVGELTVNWCSLHGIGDLGKGQKWYINPLANGGSNGNSGKTAGTALATLAAAESAAVADQNDTILALPGNYIETGRLLWDKDHTHLRGLGGPNNRGGDYGVYILTTDTGVIEVIDITAQRCQFWGVAIGNFGNNAACVAAVTLDGPGNYFNGVHFAGNLYDAQAQDADCCSLQIDSDGDNALFEDCIIGTNVNAKRTQDGSGQLLFPSVASGPTNGKFKDCEFRSWAETDVVPLISIPNTAGIDRIWQFKDCLFHNFWTNWGGMCTRVFYTGVAVQTALIALRGDCMSSGYDEWQDRDLSILFQSDMPVADIAGGLAAEPTTT